MNKIEELLRKSKGNYALSDVYVEFDKKLQNPYTTNNQLADVIQYDAGLTSFLLKVVNSAFYGFASTISSISHAITIIGRRELATLVIGKCVIDVFNDIKVKPAILNAHWSKSLSCALFAKNITKETDKSEHTPETMFVAGLIHGIGKLVIWNEYPEMADKFGEMDNQSDYLSFENNQLGYMYPEVGAYLAAKWQLPNILIKTTRYHADNNATQQSNSVITVYLANQLTEIPLQTSQNDLAEYIEPDAQYQLGLNDDALMAIFEVSNDQLSEMKSTFLSV